MQNNQRRMEWNFQEKQDAQLSKNARKRFRPTDYWGGITGAGVALQAAASGLDTGLIEMQDFAQGTSSRSTKLVHGGFVT